MALTLRVEELERRLGPELEAQPELSITIPGNLTGAAAGDTFEEQDPVDLLLREAQQLVADGDLEDLFQLETSDTEISSTRTPTGDADQLAGDADQPTGNADHPTGDADQTMGDADKPTLAPNTAGSGRRVTEGALKPLDITAGEKLLRSTRRPGLANTSSVYGRGAPPP